MAGFYSAVDSWKMKKWAPRKIPTFCVMAGNCCLGAIELAICGFLAKLFSSSRQ